MKRILTALLLSCALAGGAQAQDEAAWTAALEAGTAAYRRGGYEEATRHFETALMRAEAFGANNSRVATSLAWLTEMYRVQRRYLDAERLIRRAIQIDEQIHGPEHADVAMSLNSLALLFHSQGRLSEVEAPLTRALLIFQKVLGPEHPRMATNLHNLGALYRSMGRDGDAVPLYRRALELREKALGAAHRDTTLSRDALAATELALRATPAPAPRVVAPATVAAPRAAPVAPAPAPPAPVAAAPVVPAPVTPAPVAPPPPTPAPAPPAPVTPAPAPPAVTPSVIELATPKPVAPSPSEARLAAPATATPAPAPSIATPAPAQAARTPAPAAASLPSVRTAARTPADPAGPATPARTAPAPVTPTTIAETPRPAPIVVESTTPVSPPPAPTTLARAAAAPAAPAPPAAPPGPTRDIIIAPSAMVTAQVPAAPATIAAAAAAAPAATRPVPAAPAAPSPAPPAAVAAVAPASVAATPRPTVQTHRSSLAMHLGLLAASGARGANAQTAFEVMQQARNRRATAAPQRAAERMAGGDEALGGAVRARKELLARWHELDRALVAASLRLATGDTQRLRDELAGVDREIAAQEAVMARHLPRWLEHFSPAPLSIGTVQALLAPEEALLSYLVDDGATYVVALRRDNIAFASLDIGRAELGTLVRRVRDALDPLAGSGPRAVRRPFPVELSLHLYRALVGPVEAVLGGASHVIVIPDDALEGLPFGLLATAPPATPVRQPADHAQVAWLARRFALSSVPSEGSLRALRRAGRVAAGTRPFSGWGDPVLRPGSGTAVTARGQPRFNLRDSPVAGDIRRLEPIPESRDVLFAIADVLRGTDDDLHLREDATEAALKRSELAGFGVLAFATWGLGAESKDTHGEPALVMTPPERASGDDDGLLTASEVSVLRLNADLVILPATRTAAADGTPSAQGVSELARGFLHAGARTLLAAHWPVTADSTLKLTTRMLREQALGAGKAEALRRAMLALANGEDRHEYAHPVYWAALAVIGEGGYAAATPQTTAITTGRPDPGDRTLHPVIPSAVPVQPAPGSAPAAQEEGNLIEGAGRLLRGIFGGSK